MNRKSWACLALSSALLLCAGTARAQEGPPPAPDAVMRGGGPAVLVDPAALGHSAIASS